VVVAKLLTENCKLRIFYLFLHLYLYGLKFLNPIAVENVIFTEHGDVKNYFVTKSGTDVVNCNTVPFQMN
jgi:hypothetical protein